MVTGVGDELGGGGEIGREELELKVRGGNEAGEEEAGFGVAVAGTVELGEEVVGVVEQFGGVSGGAGQVESGRVGIVGFVGAEVVGAEEDLQDGGGAILGAEFFGGAGEVGGQGFLEFGEGGDGAAKGFGAGDGFFGWRRQFEGQAGDTA